MCMRMCMCVYMCICTYISLPSSWSQVRVMIKRPPKVMADTPPNSLTVLISLHATCGAIHHKYCCTSLHHSHRGIRSKPNLIATLTLTLAHGTYAVIEAVLYTVLVYNTLQWCGHYTLHWCGRRTHVVRVSHISTPCARHSTCTGGYTHCAGVTPGYAEGEDEGHSSFV